LLVAIAVAAGVVGLLCVLVFFLAPLGDDEECDPTDERS
jgi:hypothetical protein